MKNIFVILLTLLLISCDKSSTNPNTCCNSNQWIFIANEGNMGDYDGSISMIAENGTILQTESLGDVVQSIEVYEDKLIVLVGQLHII